MAIYQIFKEQKLEASIDEIWDFISSPGNLKKITPEYMGFEITSKQLTEKMYPGMIISYKVKPLPGIKTRWVTEITHVKEKKYFVDEQRIGPYSLWHHQHHIKEIENGVMMTDIVTYRPPFGILGRVANSLIIKKQLEKIFSYREYAMNQRFKRIY